MKSKRSGFPQTSPKERDIMSLKALFQNPPKFNIFELEWKPLFSDDDIVWGDLAHLPNGHNVAVYFNQETKKMVLSSWITPEIYATTGTKKHYRYFDQYFGRQNWQKFVAMYEDFYWRHH
jgi:hypothetical protein